MRLGRKALAQVASVAEDTILASYRSEADRPQVRWFETPPLSCDLPIGTIIVPFTSSPLMRESRR